MQASSQLFLLLLPSIWIIAAPLKGAGDTDYPKASSTYLDCSLSKQNFPEGKHIAPLLHKFPKLPARVRNKAGS